MSQQFYLLIWHHKNAKSPQALKHLSSQSAGPWSYLMLHALQAEAAQLANLEDFEGLLIEVRTQEHWQICFCQAQQKSLLVNQYFQAADPNLCWHDVCLHLADWPPGLHEAYRILELGQTFSQSPHLLLGHLPALLNSWQLGFIFGETPSQTSKNSASKPQEYNAIQSIQTALQGLEPVAFQRGQDSGFDSLKLSDLIAFYRLAWFVSDQAEALLQVSEWQGTPPGWPAGGVSHLQTQVQGFVIHLDPSATPFGIFGKLDEALQLLGPSLQNGCVLDLKIAEVSLEEAFGTEEQASESDPGASQIYRFAVQDSQLRLIASWPELPVARLQKALELSVWVEQSGVWSFDSPEQLDAFIDMARQRDDYWLSDIQKTSRDIELKDEASRAFAARSLFRQDFGDVWALQQAQALEAEDIEFGGVFQGAIEQVLKAIRKPHTDEVLLDGDSGIFMQGDVTGLSANQQENLQIINDAFKSCGYHYLGDLVWLPGGDILMRVMSNATSHVAIMLTLHQIHLEIQSVFTDGSTLLSSTVPDLSSDLKLNLTRQSLPDASPAELVSFHQQYLKHSDKEPQAATADFLVFLLQLDQQLVRQFAQKIQN